MVKPREEYETIKPYTIARFKNDYILKLDMNENTLGCSPEVFKALTNITPDDFTKYPTYGEIENLIASFWSIPIEKVLITNGGDAAINSIYQTYVNENDEVIYVVPSYIMYMIDAQRVKAKIIQVPYKQKWVYPTEQVIENITDKTKLIVICSPANPTGDIVPEADICKILEAAPNAMILLDEAYWRFTKRPNKSLINLTNKYNNIAIMHTFSKDYGLAGLRIGYLASNQENLREIHKSMDPFSVNTIAIKAVEAAMKDQKFIEDYLNKIEECKPFFANALKETVEEVYDSEANFLLCKVGPRQEWYHSMLLKKKIKIRRYPNNPILDGYIRLTLGSIDQMKTFLKYFKDYDSIIFDIDGVLIDESMSYRKAIIYTYKHFTGNNLSYEEIQEYKNQGGFNNDWKLTKHLLDKEGLSIPLNKVIEKFQEFYFNDGNGFICEEKLLINPQMIVKLNQKYNLNVFTGRPKAEAEFILKKHNIYEYFDQIVTMDDIPENKGKPDPYGLEIICKKLNSKHVLFIGDMVDDIISAEKAKVDSIGILPPQDKSEKLKKLLLDTGAIEVYDNIEIALVKVFGNLVT